MSPSEKDPTALRDARCIPLARNLVKIVAAHADELPIGNNVPHEEKLRVLSLIYTEIMDEFKSANVKLDDVGYVVKLAQQSYGLVSDIVARSMEQNESVATRMLWKTHNMAELTIMDVDAVIKGEPLPDRLAQFEAEMKAKEEEAKANPTPAPSEAEVTPEASQDITPESATPEASATPEEVPTPTTESASTPTGDEASA